MARHRGKIEEWELYIPNVDDERYLFVENPDEAITMELKLMSKRERERFGMLAMKADKGPIERAKMSREFKKVFDEHVRNIKNLTINDGDPVTTGADLYESDEEDLKTDVTRALMQIGHLEAGLAKKLSSPSATSFSRQTRNADGGAQDAIRQSSQDS
jgi:hypothetical protein